MVDDTTETLLQAAAFGEGPVDPEALAAVLAESADARQRLAQLEALAAALRAEGAVVPPVGLTQTVLEAVSGGRLRRDGHGDRGETFMNRKWIVGIAATVAAALGIYVAAGGSIPPRGAEGTIGAAKRYQGQQIAKADVQLGDQALQAFLQTATFDKLRRDPALRQSFVKVVSSPAFAKLTNDAAFAQLANSDAFLALVTDAELRQLAVDADLKHLASDASLKQLGADANLKQLSMDAELRQLSTDAALQQLTNDANFKQLANDAELKHLVNDAAFKQLLIDADLMRLMQDANFAKLLQDANLRLLLSDANLRLLTNDAEFARLASDAALTNRKSGEGQKDY